MTAKGLNWDAYGHNPALADGNAKLSCSTGCPNGYTPATTEHKQQRLTISSGCQDHNKPLES